MAECKCIEKVVEALRIEGTYQRAAQRPDLGNALCDVAARLAPPATEADWREKCGVVLYGDGWWYVNVRGGDRLLYHLMLEGQWVLWDSTNYIPARFPTESTARAALAKAPPPPGVEKGKAVSPVPDEPTVAEYLAWARATFPQSTSASCLAHLRREVDELRQIPGDPGEIADCLMLLLHHAHLHGVDVAAAFRAKLEKNKARKWGAPNAEGWTPHVEERSPTPAPAQPEAKGEGFDAEKWAERMVNRDVHGGYGINTHDDTQVQSAEGTWWPGPRLVHDEQSASRATTARNVLKHSLSAAFAAGQAATRPRRWPEGRPSGDQLVHAWDGGLQAWFAVSAEQVSKGAWWRPMPPAPPEVKP